MYVSRRLSSGGAEGMICLTEPAGGADGTAAIGAGEGTAIGAIGADETGVEALSKLVLSITLSRGVRPLPRGQQLCAERRDGLTTHAVPGSADPPTGTVRRVRYMYGRT